jgi:type VI secretion system secreted protein VgrG
MSDLVPVAIDTPLGPGALTFRSMRAVEALGRPFNYSIDLVSADPNIELTDLLGQTMTVHLEVSDGNMRHFNGYVTSVHFVEGARPAAVYRVTLQPWLSLLANTADCRIFQNKSIPDIVKQIFNDRGFSDFEDSLTGDYPSNDYIVQYRETDFNFVSRLMAQAGIYYFFTHTASLHTLVLADSASAHEATPGCETLPYYPPDLHRTHLEDHVDQWRLTQQITPGAVAVRDFDFQRPRADLTANARGSASYAHSDGEIYDYPGEYTVRADGETVARVRLEQQQERFEHGRGHSNARALTVGALLTLSNHPRDDQNREYLIVSADTAISGHELQSGGPGSEFTFQSEFSAIDSKIPFRTAPTIRKPVVQGPQTAVVVGKAGEEIWTDKYGRVKVQFHWDRLGANDENSSCWVRVAQVWAGSNWGFMQIPRIGQEVIVDFLEGDPDRPIVTGRVYNANNMPPFDLPANQTQSGVKSRSTKGGGIPNSNEIRFEDLKGSEEVYFQAEKDLNSLVKNNETRKVGANRTTSIGVNEAVTVGKDRTKSVTANETITVGGNEQITISGNETIAIVGNEGVQIGGTETVTIAGDQNLVVVGSRSRMVGVTETVVVAAAQSITAGSQAVTVGSRATIVAAADTLTVGGGRTETIGGDLSTTIGGGRTNSVGGDEAVNISGGQTVTVGKAGALTVTKQLLIDAGEELVIQSGDASITLKKNGDIVFKGKNISSDASGKITVKASSDVVLKGSKISQN